MIFLNENLLIIIIGAAVAGFVQGLSGFAFRLVAMSFWAWTIDPHLAVAMTVFGGVAGLWVGLAVLVAQFQLFGAQ